MTPYWDNLLDKESIIHWLQRPDCVLFDCRNEPYSEGLHSSYPSYQQRRFKLFQFGSCVGYTTPEIIQELPDVFRQMIKVLP